MRATPIAEYYMFLIFTFVSSIVKRGFIIDISVHSSYTKFHNLGMENNYLQSTKYSKTSLQITS